jgi:hypothetical protein
MRSTLAALALTGALLTPNADGLHLLDHLWTLFSSIWSEPADKEGCGMDPLGRCAPAPEDETEAGCGADPDGGCEPAPQAQTKEGCGADPNGRCSSTP